MRMKIIVLIILFKLSPISAQKHKSVKIHTSFGLSNRTEALLKTIKNKDKSTSSYVLNKSDVVALLDVLQKTDICIKAIVENISNKRTIAYKKFRTIDAISGIGEVNLIRSFEMGPFDATGRKLDVALLNENSFFAFMNDSGDLVFSRDGSLFINVDGFIVNRIGYYIYPKIQLVQNSLIGKLHIEEDGTFFVKDDMDEDKKIGQIKIFTFQNPEILSFEKGCNCFISSLSNKKHAESNLSLNNEKIILSGFLELSNVKILEEQVDYLELIRFYNLIYDTITRLDPSFSGVYKTHIYDPKYVDSINTDIK
ncbi:flagellar hook basal-body protein [Leptospira borgpetersenii]|uniref:Flagellar hook protein FlgE/F/G-like D1 domain-containing protein n=3 Tax=Leptospira borgpetersenii TaxID=174 RepID=A0A0E3B0P7_LEPBO|nr:flagellar hook basal-body protein [Leptospira borgpetersenii]ALO26816.1 hypothetical protein LBBP_02587 [Leptospira borgpetersenii serovar Ballum]ANH01340.1 Uncharacterized protein LB4E_2048 [Leptospira borgpetersenii str. 4E]AXX16516.1 flagellar hook basal-body protein [Leptospira borgpetersenii serovar Ceylonica]EKQ93085.1 hypothetical protein LEP1GSC101_4081 [Leptospira borgpetersenii str. UI 09149]EKR01276.1 hypothetical protein LEP1GSC121_2829 [Leptospira borgpetersenii serovar Castell